MGADILERLDFMLISRRSDEDAIIRDARAEIVRLRGEVEELKARRAEDVSILDDIRDAIGGGPYDTIAKRIRQAIAPAEAKDPAPAMPNGVEGLVQNFLDKEVHPTVRDWENRNLAGISILKHWRDFLISLTHAADNRDAAGVERQPDGYMAQWAADQLRSNKYVSCHLYNHQNKVIHGDGKEAVPFYFWPPAPAAVPAGEAVALYQLRKADGSWIDQSRNSYDYNMANGHADDLRIVYTSPPAPVQAAPQEGEAVAYLEIGPGGYLDLGTDRSDDSLLSMPPGKYMLGIIGHPSGDAVGAALRFLGELETVGNARAGEVARGLRKVAAHPSACELGAVLELVARWRQRWESLIDRGRLGDGYRVASNNVKLCADELEAALQHRGGSRGGEGS